MKTIKIDQLPPVNCHSSVLFMTNVALDYHALETYTEHWENKTLKNESNWKFAYKSREFYKSREQLCKCETAYTCDTLHRNITIYMYVYAVYRDDFKCSTISISRTINKQIIVFS
jgi:hypothetical protein